MPYGGFISTKGGAKGVPAPALLGRGTTMPTKRIHAIRDLTDEIR
jgi:hypothetical protein